MKSENNLLSTESDHSSWRRHYGESASVAVQCFGGASIGRSAWPAVSGEWRRMAAARGITKPGRSPMWAWWSVMRIVQFSAGANTYALFL